MKEFVDKLISRLEEYKYSHLVERDKERLEHCTENERAEHCEGIDCFWCVWDRAISIVKELAEEHNGGWIPCSERLPEVGVPVLVCNAQGKVYIRMINWISSGRTQIPYWSQQSTGIIAWQALPAPYQKEGDK